MKENVGLIAFLLAGCAIIAMLLVAGERGESSACSPVPMPTGEQYFPAYFHLPLPSSVWTGQFVRMEFSGGVLVAATGQHCGEEFHVLLPNQATAEATIREIQVKLDGQVIYAQSCGYHCVLEFYIPAYFPGGMYDWELSGLWDANSFPVYVQPLQLT